MNNNWKSDNYKFVGSAFDFAYANRINKMLEIMGVVTTPSVDYELTGAGGYGELLPYDGTNLNSTSMKRGFKKIITPEEYVSSIDVGFKAAKIDKLGETKKVGTRLGDAAAMTVYAHCLRMFHNAFDAAHVGGDNKSWAATDHPVAAKNSSGRTYVADTDAGTYSNKITTALSVSAITAAKSAAGRFVTPDGLPFMCDMNLLLVSPELEPDAIKICGANAKLRPTKDPANDYNAANPLPELQYMVIGGGSDGFTKKQWAICDAALMREMVKLVYITKPTVMQSELDNPLIDKYTAYVDFGMGWGDARQIIFSDPA